MSLQIGRATIFTPFIRSSPLRDTLEIECWHYADDWMDDAHAIARGLKRDLQNHIGEVVPLVWVGPAEITGYYLLREAEVATISAAGRFPCRLSLEYVGSSNDLRFESRLVGAVQANDYSIAAADENHAPPIGASYEPAHSSSFVREVAYIGDITVFEDLTLPTTKRWAVAPANYYDGAATIRRKDALYPEQGPISGVKAQNFGVEDIELDNGIVRFAIYGGAPLFEAWDGTAWRNQPLGLGVESEAPVFQRVAILHNRPERCVLSYQAPESPSGVSHLEVALVRGERGFRCRLTRDLAGTLAASTGVASTFTSNRMVRTTADGNGHKVILATLETVSTTAATGTIAKASDTLLDFYAAVELSGAGSGNTAADLGAQYVAGVSESVRAVEA